MKIINEDQKQKGTIKTMKVKGRKSKLTPELIKKISAEIENGSYQKVAARKCGEFRHSGLGLGGLAGLSVKWTGSP